MTGPVAVPERGQSWVGINHGSVLQVLGVADGRVSYLVVYSGNPQKDRYVGTTCSSPLGIFLALCRRAPEWDFTTVLV